MYDKILIGGCKHLIGNPEKDIKKKEFFNIKPEDKIRRIGRFTKNGKESSSCRVLEIDSYVTYTGIWTYEGDEYLVFEINPIELKGWNLFYPERPVFMLFNIVHVPENNHTELIRFDYDKSSLYIYQLNFELLDDEN